MVLASLAEIVIVLVLSTALIAANRRLLRERSRTKVAAHYAEDSGKLGANAAEGNATSAGVFRLFFCTAAAPNIPCEYRFQRKQNFTRNAAIFSGGNALGLYRKRRANH